MKDADDREWLDTLAGQLSRAPPTDAAPGNTDPTVVDATTLEGNPSVVDAAALEGNPFDRKGPTWRTAMRATGTRGWAAGALAVAVLLFGWHLSPKTSTSEIARASLDGIVRLEAANPAALRRQIVAELRGVGVEANGYSQLGIDGVDADLRLPVSADVRRVLAGHQIPAPADGALRIEIAASARR
jgi:hypothetical protein